MINPLTHDSFGILMRFSLTMALALGLISCEVVNHSMDIFMALLSHGFNGSKSFLMEI